MQNTWLTQGSTVAPDQTQHSVPRRKLDLESAVDLASGDEHDEIEVMNDPLLAEAVQDYKTRTHVDQYKTMQNIMQPRKRLMPEHELPPINFSINKEDVNK